MIRGDQHNTMLRLTLAILGSLVLGGCPGNLSDDFIGGAGGTSGKTAEQVFQTSCGSVGCHAANQPQVDLVSPDVASRTVGVDSTAPDCDTEILVIAGDPDNSYMMKKLLLTPPSICGFEMPVASTLDPADIDAIRQWIIDLGGVPETFNEGPDSGV